jgi:hypothetical protein
LPWNSRQLRLAKEERVYLPMFDQYMGDREQRALLDKVHESYNKEEENNGYRKHPRRA